MICTPRVAKHRLFLWVPTATLPDARLYAFAIEEEWLFGILHSRAHELWSLAMASRHGVGNDPTYSTETCFATFAFPEPNSEQRSTIGRAAGELVTMRERWLNPPEWLREEVLTFPASMDGPWSHVVETPNTDGIGTARYARLVPIDADAEKSLKKRTLTHLYNERPTWLRDLHQALDEAVLGAYGLAADVSDDALLAHLLALNLERSAAGASESEAGARREVKP